jgi:membrane-bound metal-dependent hydrolase YbcI (DUF457 family)
MFIGHFAVALASKRVAPGASLGWLIAACELVDLLWPVFLIAGWEEVRVDPGNTAFTPLDFVHYPYTHSLLMGLVWGLLLGWIYLRRANDRRGGVVIAAIVVSHWVLDWITHRPDLPLYPGSPKFGLGLWNSVPATMAIEIAMFAVGVAIYGWTTTALDRKGAVGFWTFVAFLLLTYLANIFGGPPPNVAAIEISALLLWILVFWARWFDNHRRVALTSFAAHP